ncbi:MAG: hypothetical protein GXO83_08650 [Chlorobi bacterium]|nr:hypothetical protein [Chlorobiota bacterium]
MSILNFKKSVLLPGVALPGGIFSVHSSGGHCILIIPEYNMVIEHRVNTDKRGNKVTTSEMGHLTRLILEA